MRISDWSSDVCSSDLFHARAERIHHAQSLAAADRGQRRLVAVLAAHGQQVVVVDRRQLHADPHFAGGGLGHRTVAGDKHVGRIAELMVGGRSEEHTSELQSLMRSSYAVLCWKKTKK